MALLHMSGCLRYQNVCLKNLVQEFYLRLGLIWFLLLNLPHPDLNDQKRADFADEEEAHFQPLDSSEVIQLVRQTRFTQKVFPHQFVHLTAESI